MAQLPGTVSKILWHFTGGPKWNGETSEQDSKPKPHADAYQALLSILRSRELRLGGYREVVKVNVPSHWQYDFKANKKIRIRSKIVNWASVPVCCLSDIPIAHLSYHAGRYGKMAIGFHRNAAVRHGFNPVFYSLHNTPVVRAVRQGFLHLRKIDADTLEASVDDIERTIDDLEPDDDSTARFEIDLNIRDIRRQVTTIEEAVTSADKSFREFLAFMKTFARTDFSTIYCEREWRATKPFSFSMSDLAMVVLPKARDAGGYFDEFLEMARRLKIPRSIPLVPWEDLVEH